MKRVQWSFAVLGVSLLLIGCGSSPPVRYYTLEPIPATATQDSPEYTIGIGPLRFPEYLKRPQIVSYGDAGEVVVAEFDRWADAAESAFQRTLAQNLTSLLANTMAIEFPFGGGLVSPHYRLVGQINGFGTDAQGLATLDISWTLVDAEDETLLGPRRSVFTAQSTSQGYGDRVNAMNETLREFSEEIADSFAQALAAREDQAAP